MDSEVLAHIFEPFFTTKAVGHGTGLGLAAVFGTLKEHHGAIAAESELGKGAVFRVYLPVDTEEPGAGTGPYAESVVLGAGRILVVDDEEIIRQVAQSMLEGMGYEVILANDGQEAVDIYARRGGEIDLVMLDLVMPKMNGQEALRHMHALNPKVRALIATGYSLGIEFETLRPHGALGVIQKPFKRAELSRCVAAAIAGRRMRSLNR